MTTVILWRHGNTDWNNESRFQGQADATLNERGIAQAEAAAAKLALFQPKLLVTSDLSRCTRTAAALSELTGLPAERDSRLRERGFGQWETRTRAEVERDHPAVYLRWHSGHPNPGCGIEPIADLGKRVSEAIGQVAERVPDQLAVLVTHGGAAKWGIGSLLGWRDEAVQTLGGLGNCRWAQLVHDPGRGWVLVGYNLGG